MSHATPMPWVLNLAEIDAGDAGRVGLKARRLGALIRGGFPVPAGFCLTTTATARWDDAVRAALATAYRSLGGRVSVRSSAVEEDAVGASYAGVYHSELPVEGETDVIAAVGRCLAAWHAPAARAYRDLHGDGRAPVMAVVVQRLVEASAAGVAYTRDPLAPEKREVHLNTVWGLAEPLAAGRVAGDSMALSRRGRLLELRISHKPTELTADGPRAVVPERAAAASLSLAQARRVMLLARAAERHFGAPQDVEFAFEGDRLWLLQSRPLVRAAADRDLDRFLDDARRQLGRRWRALRAAGRLQGGEMVLSNGNIGELLPTPSTMSFGLFRHLFAGRHGAIVRGRHRLGYRFDAARVDYLFEQVAGQPYFNLEIDATTFGFGTEVPIDDILQRVAADPALANYPELRLYRQAFDGAAKDDDAGLADDFHRRLCAAGRAWLARFEQGLPAGIVGGPPTDWLALGADACARAIAGRIRHLRRGPCVAFVEIARLGFYFAACVHRRLAAHFGGEGEGRCAGLLAGLPGSIVTQQALDLEALAEGRLAREVFLQRYGHCAPNELEISEPRLAEQPQRIERLLDELRRSGRRPGLEFERQQGERMASEAALWADLAARGLSAGQRTALAEELRLAQALLPLRETVKHHYTAIHADIRDGLLRLAAHLDWPPARIFDLQPRELRQALREPERWRLIAERRACERQLARRAAREGRLPAVIFASRADEIGAPPPPANGDRWQGSALAPGRRRGIARVLRDDGVMPELAPGGGEILVVRAANLGLAPLLRMVAGLVVEVGGLLAHSACQAREAGIPAVALADATRRIKDGMALLIDGAAGEITCLDDVASDMGEARHGTRI